MSNKRDWVKYLLDRIRQNKLLAIIIVSGIIIMAVASLKSSILSILTSSNVARNADSKKPMDSALWITDQKTSRSFRLTNCNFSELRQAIIETCGLTYDPSSDATYDISFGQTGEIYPADNSQMYLYNGGSITIMIDGSECTCLDQLKLMPWHDYPGNPRNILENRINAQMQELIRTNQDAIIAAMESCVPRYDK